MPPRPPAALPLTFCVCLLLFLPATASPQMVVMETTSLKVHNSAGVVAELNSVGDLLLGGHGRNGDVALANLDGDTTITLNGGVGDITIGGGNRNGQAYLVNAGDITTLTLDSDLGNITLGGGIADGDIFLRDHDGTTPTIHLDGGTGLLRLGNVDSSQAGRLEVRDSDGTGLFLVDGATGTVDSNQLSSNGLVKAWARMEGDGNVASCWRCNTATGETQRLGPGQYEVDFTLLGALDGDIRSRPWTCSVGNGTQSQFLGTTIRGISCFIRSDDNSSIHVTTWVFQPDGGTDVADAEFTIVVY